MIKKSFIVMYIIFLLVISTLSAMQVEVVEANPFMFGPYIGIVSPELFNEKTYQTSTIPIEVQIETPTDYPKIIKIYYILDLNYSSNNNPQYSLSISNPSSHTYSGVPAISYFGTGTLRNLVNGSHTIDAYAVNAEGKNIKSSTRNFLVNITATPYPTQNRNAPHLDPIFYLLPISIILAIIILTIAIYRRRKLTSKQRFLYLLITKSVLRLNLVQDAFT